MFNWLKELLSPTSYNSTTTFKCDVPMPKVKAPKIEGISEPVLAMLRSMQERSRDWKIRNIGYDSDLDIIYNISDDKSGFSFQLEVSSFNSLDVCPRSGLEWMTWREQKAIVNSCQDLYIKRLARLQAIKSVTEKKKTDKVRNYWKEKYQ